jgi:hypothetical protein
VVRPDQPERPTTIVVAAALTMLTGSVNVLVGSVLLILLGVDVLPNRPGMSSATLMTMGWGYLLLGAPTLAGGFGLLVGRSGSRAFVTVLMMVRIALACISFGLLDAWYAGGSVLGIAAALVVITLLWDSRANAYFHRAD